MLRTPFSVSLLFMCPQMPLSLGILQSDFLLSFILTLFCLPCLHIRIQFKLLQLVTSVKWAQMLTVFIFALRSDAQTTAPQLGSSSLHPINMDSPWHPSYLVPQAYLLAGWLAVDPWSDVRRTCVEARASQSKRGLGNASILTNL